MAIAKGLFRTPRHQRFSLLKSTMIMDIHEVQMVPAPNAGDIRHVALVKGNVVVYDASHNIVHAITAVEKCIIVAFRCPPADEREYCNAVRRCVCSEWGRRHASTDDAKVLPQQHDGWSLPHHHQRTPDGHGAEIGSPVGQAADPARPNAGHGAGLRTQHPLRVHGRDCLRVVAGSRVHLTARGEAWASAHALHSPAPNPTVASSPKRQTSLA
eukprot:1169724-Prymnesium_polylepis.3